MYKAGPVHSEGDNPQCVLKMKASADRSKGDAVYIDMDSDGFVDLTIASNTTVHYIAVANENITSGDTGDYVIQGEVKINVTEALYTAGNGLNVTTGAIVDGGAYPAGGVADEAQTDFGVIKTTETTTTVLAVLHGEPFTSA
jgi:hypothetical protein